MTTQMRNKTKPAGQKSSENDGGYAEQDRFDAPQAVLDQIVAAAAAAGDRALIDRQLAKGAALRRISVSIEDERIGNLVDTIHSVLVQDFAGAVRATFYRGYDDDDTSPALARVYGEPVDGQDVILFDGDSPGDLWASVNSGKGSINFIASQLGNDAGAYFDGNSYETDEEGNYGDGELSTLDLTKPRPETSFNLADAIGVKWMTRHERSALIRDAAYEQGMHDSGADKDEIEYRVFEDPASFGIDPATGPALERRFGGREQALNAIVDTSVWAAIGEDLSASASFILSNQLPDAIAELTK